MTELFELITGRVKDFVFKHDSVRTIQTALKYANQEQRKTIAKELKGEYKTLVEGKYSKFLVAKILVQGDAEIRSMVVQEFYGHVKKLINHPEAGWILDDSYRQIATADQKAKLLREWYGAEYSMLRTADADKTKPTADLVQILNQSPEKRQTILQHLHGMIDQLINKKMTAFTMLHDAMLQYSLVISTALDGSLDTKSEPVKDWVQSLVPDEESEFDLLKNLAFTASGSRVVTRALAMASAKDRRHMLRVYKDHIETVACDANAVHVLLAAYEVVDDTRLVSKLVFPELLAEKIENQEEREAGIVAIAVHAVGRIPLLWPLASEGGRAPKWLVNPRSQTGTVMVELNDIKAVAETTKKQDSARTKELSEVLLATSKEGVLTTIQNQATSLATTAFGCQFMTEVLLHGGNADMSENSSHSKALTAVSDVAKGDPSQDHVVAGNAAGGRMLKTLSQGGLYDPDSGHSRHVPWLNQFPEQLWKRIHPHVEAWATGSESFVVLALTENEHFAQRNEVVKALKKCRQKLETASDGGNKGAEKLLAKL